MGHRTRDEQYRPWIFSDISSILRGAISAQARTGDVSFHIFSCYREVGMETILTVIGSSFETFASHQGLEGGGG